MATSGTKISGAKQLKKLFSDLPKKAISINRKAVNVATTPILRAIKACVPVDHGDLKKALIKKVSNRGFDASGIVGADADYVGENGEKPAKYDFLVEAGHITPNGVVVAAQPFMRNGFNNGYDAAAKKYEDALASAIEKAAEQLGGK